MPNIKSQKKRVLTNNKRRLANVQKKSALKSAIKNVIVAVEAKDKALAQSAYVVASSKLDSAVTSGFHHKNYASRQKSRLAKLVNSIEA